MALLYLEQAGADTSRDQPPRSRILRPVYKTKDRHSLVLLFPSLKHKNNTPKSQFPICLFSLFPFSFICPFPSGSGLGLFLFNANQRLQLSLSANQPSDIPEYRSLSRTTRNACTAELRSLQQDPPTSFFLPLLFSPTSRRVIRQQDFLPDVFNRVVTFLFEASAAANCQLFFKTEAFACHANFASQHAFSPRSRCLGHDLHRHAYHAVCVTPCHHWSLCQLCQ